MLLTLSQNLTLQEVFETAAQINEEQKKRNSIVHPSNRSKLQINRFSSFFFAKRRKSVEKIIHPKNYHVIT